MEGGLALPVSFALAGPVTVTLGPEVDLLADADGHGRHAAIVQLVNLSAPVAPRLTLIGELWANWNFDPDGHGPTGLGRRRRGLCGDQHACSSTPAPISGLTRETPDIQLYAGASIRF